LNVYVLYIHDDRYSVPTVDSITASDDEIAKQLLKKRLDSSPHYVAVALWQGERFVARIEMNSDSGLPTS